MKERIELAAGLEISRIVTGLWQIADMERNGETLDTKATAEFMNGYVDAGMTSFDMADHYGSSEIITGVYKNTFPKGNRVQLFTKWVPTPGTISKEQVREAVELSLDRMQQTSIDLMQFHAWNYPDPSWLDGLFYLQELKEEGLINNIGVTNFDAAHLRVALASGIPIVSNQVSHSLIDQRASKDLKDVCEAYSVKLLAFGTLAGGFLSEKWLNVSEPKMDELATWSQMKYKRYIDEIGGWDIFQKLLLMLKAIGDKYEVSIANVASRFVLENDAVAAVIIGARLGASEHISSNQKILGLDLDKDDLESIAIVQKEMKPIPGDCGDEYRKPPFLTASGDLSHHVESFPLPYQVSKINEHKSQVFSGTVWEDLAGYSRAFKDGNRIFVSGTTATHGDKMIGGTDAAAQAHFVIDKLEAAITSLGGSLTDVVRTRVFVNDINDWEPVARAHGNRFKNINPANTLVEAKLVGDGYLVEMEADAIIH